MHEATTRKLAQSGEQRLALWRRAPGAFFVSSMLAGAYVGVGIVLIFVLGSSVPLEWRKLVMAASFGIALTLVVMAGAELFTGHHLYGTLDWLTRGAAVPATLLLWGVCWIGNLAVRSRWRCCSRPAARADCLAQAGLGHSESKRESV